MLCHSAFGADRLPVGLGARYWTASTSGSVDAGRNFLIIGGLSGVIGGGVQPPELSTCICGAVDAPAVVGESAPASVGAAGAVDGPGGGASAAAGVPVAVPVAPPAPAPGNPSSTTQSRNPCRSPRGRR